MYDKEILKLYLDNGLQHIVISKQRAISCANCGAEVQGTAIFSVDGTITKLSESMVVIETIEGDIKTIRNESIISIDNFDPSIAKRKYAGRLDW